MNKHFQYSSRSGLMIPCENRMILNPYRFSGGGGGTNFTTSLGGHWKLNEASGNAADSSGNGTTLTNNNTVTFSAAKLGNGGNFTAASSQSFSVADNNFISTSPDISFSVQAWAKVTDKSASRFVVDKSWSEGSFGEFVIYYSNGRDAWVASAANGNIDLTDLTVGSPSTSTLYHLVLTYDAATDTASFYVNAGTPRTATWAGGNSSSTGGFRIGGYAGNFFNGQIDDVAIWPNRVLSASEVAELFAANAGLDF